MRMVVEGACEWRWRNGRRKTECEWWWRAADRWSWSRLVDWGKRWREQCWRGGRRVVVEGTGGWWRTGAYEEMWSCRRAALSAARVGWGRTWPRAKASGWLRVTGSQVACFMRLGAHGWLMIALEAWSFDMSSFLAAYLGAVSHSPLRFSPCLVRLIRVVIE